MLFPPESLAIMQRLTKESLEGEVEFVIQQGATQNESGDVYDPLTDTWSSGPPPAGVASISHKFDAEQVGADPAKFSAMGISLLNAIVLKVQPDPENTFKPRDGMKMVWPSGSGKNFSVSAVDPVAPDGTDTLWYVYASGGAQTTS
jgi:hypothetical protein